jgi:hypothetical protein
VRTRPDLALKATDGSIVRDNDGLAWSDPLNRAVQDYNVAIAVATARQGFDEIQFDYVRFPGTRSDAPIDDRMASTRRAAIRDFLAQARTALEPYNVFLAADIFGYECWDHDDADLGQQLEEIAAQVDYICPMLYPSSFAKGIPAARMPLDHPDKIVYLSLARAALRTGAAPNRFRPWLQAFTDYGFDHRQFKGKEIKAQAEAAESFGSNGWMLWNSHNSYSMKDLPRPERPREGIAAEAR